MSHPSKRFHPHASIPPPLDIAELFNLDANSTMWMDAPLHDGEEGHTPPAYLADPKMQEGILGWLRLQRCKEEELRLFREIGGLISWISSQISAIKQAMDACQGTLWAVHAGVHTILA